DRWEREYLVYRGRLNRLTLYSPPLARSETSVVMCPGGERMEGSPMPPPPPEAPGNLIHETSNAFLLSGLLNSLCDVTGTSLFTVMSHSVFLSSDHDPGSPFFTSSHKVLSKTSFTPSAIRKEAAALGAGKITPRIPIDPGEYWTFRRKLEEDLEGQRHLYLFKWEPGALGKGGGEPRAILCEKIPTGRDL
ncbi:MAG: hypothetical protein J7L61_00270, partial [Thermoplasmata archaeon]|nr:hypothetical protein [Thermoplasmata archaeon]